MTAISVLAAEFVSPGSSATYGDSVGVIELINEAYPQDAYSLQVLRDYYANAYGVVRGDSSQVVVAIGDAFEGLGSWLDFMPEPGFDRVMMDTVSGTMQVASEDM